MNDNAPDRPWLDTDECAAYLSIPRDTLLYWRRVGKGPPHHKFGKHVRYARADVDAWTATCAVGKTA